MKLLIATPLYPPDIGGPATYVKLLEERLPQRGIEVEVVKFSDVRHLPKIIRHIAYFLKVLSRSRAGTLVYALDTVSVGLPAALAATLAGKKFVVRVPGDYAWEQGRQRFGVQEELDAFQTTSYGLRIGVLRSIQKFVVSRAKAVVVPSEYMRGIVAGWDARNIHRIYSSIEMPQPGRIERPPGFLVVSSGRRVPWKHFDAIERVVKCEPGWQFHLVENVSREEALGWVKAADVYVLNSTYEGLSHALIEAMLLGIPVVATNVGGNPELIENGVTGLLVPPKDDEALYAALKKVEQDKELAFARAQTARTRMKAFSIDTTLSQLVELLKTI